MSIARGIDGSESARGEPIGRRAGVQEERRVAPSRRVACGSLACPASDAPVALVTGPRSPADRLGCPFCGHAAAVRDFLSLALPSRPARVEVRVVGASASASAPRGR